MASSIVLLFLVAILCMSQSVDANCFDNDVYCDTSDQCCSNQCLAGICCQNAGSCTNDLDCCIHRNGTGGCNANRTCGTCVPENGTCTTTTDCCFGVTPFGLTCANNICVPILYNAYYNTIVTYFSSIDILGFDNAFTILKISLSFIQAFAPHFEIGPLNITVDEVAALGVITRDTIIAIFNASAAMGLLPDVPRIIDNIAISDVCDYFRDLITVALSQPHITFSDVPNLHPDLITSGANSKISDFANIVQDFIDDIEITGSDTMLEVADTIGGDITVNDLASIAGIGDIANVGDLTLAKAASAADLLAELSISLSNDNVCNSDSNCCSGSNCKCCQPVRSGINFCGTCPCVNNGTCSHGSDCCNGRCCNGGGHGKNCNGNLCRDGRGNCACAVKKN